MESHQHRIFRLYKRAVLNNPSKEWSHFFKFGERVVNFILVPLEGFFDAAPLIDSSEARYNRLMEFAEQAKGIDQVRFDEMHDWLVVCHQEQDWLQEVDLLDDLEDFISETAEEQVPINLARLNSYINKFSFIYLKRQPEDEELKVAVEFLNKCAKIYCFSNFIIRPGHFKRQIDHLVNACNGRRIKKDAILQKIEDLKNLLLASFTKPNLARAIERISIYDASIYLTPVQKDKLLKTLDDKEKDEDFALSLISVIDEFSGENLLKTQKKSHVSFRKSHWNDIFINFEKIIHYTKFKLTTDLLKDFEKLSALLMQDLPDNHLLEAITERISKKLLIACEPAIIDKYIAYTKSPRACQKKIASIENLVNARNLLSAYVRIIGL